jgi:hypothetical protein
LLLVCGFEFLFVARPAGKPGPLRNCSLFNQTGESLEVECAAGFDGGLPQKFVLEVYEALSNQLRLNLSNEVTPAFRVSELLPGSSTLLRMVLYAANPKGRGEATVLENIALWDAERRTGTSNSSDPHLVWLLFVFFRFLLYAMWCLFVSFMCCTIFFHFLVSTHKHTPSLCSLFPIGKHHFLSLRLSAQKTILISANINSSMVDKHLLPAALSPTPADYERKCF